MTIVEAKRPRPIARRSVFALALGAAALAGSCGQGGDDADGADAGAATTAPVAATASSAATTSSSAADAAGLTGIDWQLTTLVEGESSGPLPDGVRGSLRIEGSELTVDTGCNRGGASVAVQDGALRMTQPLLLTQRGCDGDALRVEQFVVKVLDSNPMYRVEAGRLRLDSGLGRSLEFVPAA
ncbi:MAG: META domain-containing protein [Acidimicrobiales bacterium]|nr:META domain-containing protein [Acidimicrobiales bacterium]